MEPKRKCTEEMNLWVERDESDSMLKNKIQKNTKECNLQKDTNTNQFIQLGPINL